MGGRSPRGGRFRLRGVEHAYIAYEAPAVVCPDVLSPAEKEVAALVARGRSTADIARARRVSPRTVANQLASIFRKLGVSSRQELLLALHEEAARSRGRRSKD